MIQLTIEEPVTRLLKRTSPMMRGDDIWALHEQLNKLGCSHGAVDGIFVGKTKAGVSTFQTAARVKVDGIAGPVKQGVLKTALSGLPATATCTTAADK